MVTGRERIKAALSHQNPDRIPVDFGGTPVSGIHVLAVSGLRDYFGLDNKPIKIVEPYQMLGEIDDELKEILDIDTIGLVSRKNMFGIANENWKEFRMPWGQVVMVPGEFNATVEEDGGLLTYPEGDSTMSACAKMPVSGYFFDAIMRQDPLDDSTLRVEDNLEEFGPISDEDLIYWKNQVEKNVGFDQALVAVFGGTAFGDIALVPALHLKYPKGIRDISEWYISTVSRREYVHAVFERQCEIGLLNLEKIFSVVGNTIEAVFVCGTDFGTQSSQFCSTDTYNDLYAPYYKRVNAWIHEYTQWKSMKHSCGAVEPLMRHFIDSGFDIINPVQVNAAGMDPARLKEEYGDHIVFWGGGVDTQKILPFGQPEEVEEQVIRLCDIFSQNGGFVFNAVHNIQANVPVINIVSIFNGLRRYHGERPFRHLY